MPCSVSACKNVFKNEYKWGGCLKFLGSCAIFKNDSYEAEFTRNVAVRKTVTLTLKYRGLMLFKDPIEIEVTEAYLGDPEVKIKGKRQQAFEILQSLNSTNAPEWISEFTQILKASKKSWF